MTDDTSPRRAGDLIPIVGGLWIVLCGFIPGTYFAVLHHSLWGNDVDVVPLAAAATAGQLWFWYARHRWAAYIASVLWVAVSIALLAETLPLAGGFAALIAFRSMSAFVGHGD